MEILIALMAVIQVVQLNLVGNVIMLYCQAPVLLYEEIVFLLVHMNNEMTGMEIIQMDVM